MARISIDGVARETMAEARAHWSAFATLTAAFVFLPSLVFGLLAPSAAASLQMPAPGVMPHFAGWLVPAVLVGIVLQSWVTLTIAGIAGDPARPEHETVGATLARMAPTLLRYLGALVLMFVGYLLLAVPLGMVVGLVTGTGFQRTGVALGVSGPGAGLLVIAILALVLWLAARLAPMAGVFAVERTGPVAGLRRSWALTSGSTGRIVLLIIVMLIAALVVVVAGQALAAAFASAVLLAGAATLAKVIQLMVAGAVNALLFMLYSAGVGVLYRRLRA